MSFFRWYSSIISHDEAETFRFDPSKKSIYLISLSGSATPVVSIKYTLWSLTKEGYSNRKWQPTTSKPVSSLSSRTAASLRLSPFSAPPPGKKKVRLSRLTTKMPSGVSTMAVPLRLLVVTLSPINLRVEHCLIVVLFGHESICC